MGNEKERIAESLQGHHKCHLPNMIHTSIIYIRQVAITIITLLHYDFVLKVRFTKRGYCVIVLHFTKF